MLFQMTNVISVSGQSTLVKEPDCAVLKIEIVSSKNNSDESSHSISRRLEYINQVLRLHDIRKHNIIGIINQNLNYSKKFS